MYDQFGMAGVNNDPNQGFGGGPGGQGFNPQDFGNFGDFFDMFGGGGGPGGFGGGRQPQRRSKLEPIVLEIQVSLEDLFFGKEVEVGFQRMEICPSCNGKGGKNVKVCPTCNGSGYVVTTRNLGGMVMQQQEICGTCGGEGEVRIAPGIIDSMIDEPSFKFSKIF